MTPALVLDAGALIALDRNDRATWAMLRVAADSGTIIQVPAGVVAQAWRDGARQVLLSRALAHCDEVPLNGSVARLAGLLLSRSRTSDVIDATVALAAHGLNRTTKTVVLTSDPGDIKVLTDALDTPVRIETV